MLRLSLLAFALTLSTAQAATPIIDAQVPAPLSDDEMAEIVDFIVGNAVFALYHQAGHMMMQKFSVNASGGERAADQFAVMTLLDPRSGAGDQTLVDAIDGWRLASHPSASAGSIGLDLPDRHSIDGDRANAIVCDMVGADKDGFADVADAAGLSAEARTQCAQTYHADLAAWTEPMRRYRRAATTPVVSLPVVYDDPADGDVAEATILQDNRVLEEVATKLADQYALPSPPTVRARSCGDVGSSFDADKNELVLCYELSAYHGQLILRDIERRH